MVSVRPVSRLTVAVMLCVVGLIVARTAPGKTRPSSTAKISVPSGESPTERTTAVPSSAGAGPVEIVVVTAWVLKLMTEIPPPLPAFAT